MVVARIQLLEPLHLVKPANNLFRFLRDENMAIRDSFAQSTLGL